MIPAPTLLPSFDRGLPDDLPRRAEILPVGPVAGFNGKRYGWVKRQRPGTDAETGEHRGFDAGHPCGE
ncbi:hypothetical protein M2324_000058 [Rhodovulum sulfidophilum]|nr:hypothetical protein [Rhodovulum sulfidophilum]